MAVLKTKTKLTKSKFTKNNYSTKKKNVSRMTKKKNVMKGGMKPIGNGSMRQKPPPLPPRKYNPPLYAVPNKNRQPQYNLKSIMNIEKYMEGEGKYVNKGTRRNRLTENQKKQIRNLNIFGNRKNVDQQIRNILVNSSGKSKFAPEAVRELMKQPSYLKSLAHNSIEYLNIADKPPQNKGVYIDIN